jgi:hypothetical protein
MEVNTDGGMPQLWLPMRAAPLSYLRVPVAATTGAANECGL